MEKPDFDKGTFGRLRKNAGGLWQAYVGHPFVNQLAAGTLEERCFKKFLTQDYLFLVHFSRAYALLAAKSTNIGDIREALDGLKSIIEEMPLHVAYAKKWGISEQEMGRATEAMETIAYTRYVLDVGYAGDRLDLMAALLPCVAGYAEVGSRLAGSKTTVFNGNRYSEWIKNYESEEYIKGVIAFIDSFNKLAEKYEGEAHFHHLSEIFNTATRLETKFWQMGLDA